MISNLDVWSDAPDSAPGDEAACAQRRRQRRSMLAAVGGSYLIDALLLGLFALAGTVQTSVPAAYFAAGLGHVVLFSLLWRGDFSERLASRQLVEWQVAYAVAVQLVFVAWVPAITTYFLSIIFIVFAFASLRLGIRNALIM